MTHAFSREAALKSEKDCVTILGLFMQTLTTLDSEWRKTSVAFSELSSVSTVDSVCVSLHISNQQ